MRNRVAEVLELTDRNPFMTRAEIGKLVVLKACEFCGKVNYYSKKKEATKGILLRGIWWRMDCE